MHFRAALSPPSARRPAPRSRRSRAATAAAAATSHVAHSPVDNERNTRACRRAVRRHAGAPLRHAAAARRCGAQALRCGTPARRCALGRAPGAGARGGAGARPPAVRQSARFAGARASVAGSANSTLTPKNPEKPLSKSRRGLASFRGGIYMFFGVCRGFSRNSSFLLSLCTAVRPKPRELALASGRRRRRRRRQWRVATLLVGWLVRTISETPLRASRGVELRAACALRPCVASPLHARASPRAPHPCMRAGRAQ